MVEPLGPGSVDAATGTHHYLEEVAIQAALQISSGQLKVERQRPLIERVSNYFLSRRPLIDSVTLRMAREKVMKQTAGNYPAPLKILDVVRTGLVDGKQEGYEKEAKVKNFLKLIFLLLGFWRTFSNISIRSFNWTISW